MEKEKEGGKWILFPILPRLSAIGLDGYYNLTWKKTITKSIVDNYLDLTLKNYVHYGFNVHKPGKAKTVRKILLILHELG